MVSMRRASQAMAVLLGLAVAGAGHAQVDEYALKAAFVYNIAAFAQSAHPRASTLTICTQTGEALGAAVGALGGRDLAGRRVTVVRAAAATAGGCDVLVHDADRAAPASVAALVICDACTLPNGVSTVTLVREGNKIRFDVDATRARANGVTLSSQLLRLARRVL